MSGYIPSLPFQPTPSQVSTTVNALAQKANNTADLTLTANAASTTMTDPRLSNVSVLTFMPTTANAAAALTSIYVTDLKKGEATINHVNDADADKTYRISIHG